MQNYYKSVLEVPIFANHAEENPQVRLEGTGWCLLLRFLHNGWIYFCRIKSLLVWDIIVQTDKVTLVRLTKNEDTATDEHC